MVTGSVLFMVLVAAPLRMSNSASQSVPTARRLESSRACNCDLEEAGRESARLSDYEREIYLLGARFGQMATRQFVSRLLRSNTEIEVLAQGFRAGALGEEEPKDLEDLGESRLLGLQEPWRKKQREIEAGYVRDASKKPGAVLLEKGVVLVMSRKGTKELPVDESVEFVARMRISKRNGKVVKGETSKRISKRSIKEMPAALQQALGKMRIGGEAQVLFPPGVLDLSSPALAEWEAAVVDLELADAGSQK